MGMSLRRHGRFAHPIVLDGWSPRSVWGYDPDLECYWAELWRTDADPVPTIRVGVEHLVTTVDGLAAAVSQLGRVRRGDAFMALTA
jgi:hypothetical protein